MPVVNLNAIVTQGSPVLCIDTCTVLDLMRNPAREEIRPQERTAAMALLAAVEQGRLIVVMADQVIEEIGDHHTSVEEEARKGVEKIKAQFDRIQALDVAYGGTGGLNFDHLDDHVARSRRIFDRWTACALTVQPGPGVTNRAYLRVTKARAPARRGKESMKDCVVIETYLEAVSALRSAGFPAAVVFASSNVKDYTDGAGSGLRADLGQDFAAINMSYAPNWSAAKHSLDL